MLRYTLSRLAVSLALLGALSMLVFVLLRLAPGDPIDAYIDPTAGISRSELDVMRRDLGLDQPIPVQYLAWAREVARGNLGYSTQSVRQPVARLIGERIGPTLLLMGAGFGLAVLLGLATGIWAAIRRNGPVDLTLAALAFIGLSSPAFLNALIGLFLFSVWLRWAPSGGMTTTGLAPSALDTAKHLVLPALILAIGHAAMIMRYMRASLLDVLGQDYVRTARAKGVREFWVIVKHAVRNALLPVVTLIGSSLGAAIGGAIFIESVFNWPGMGLMLVTAVEARDYPVIMGATLVIGACVLVVNLVTDLAYAAIDPRIKLA